MLGIGQLKNKSVVPINFQIKSLNFEFKDSLSDRRLGKTKITPYKIRCQYELDNGNLCRMNLTFGVTWFIPYPTAFPYGNSMVLHFYQQQESSTTKTVHKVINKGLKTYV